MVDELLLLSGNDIPFQQARLIVHQPRLKEIAYITESRFWPACELLKFDKASLPDQDKNGLLNRSNFNIIMTMMRERNMEAHQAQVNVLSILALLFPTSEISLGRTVIQLRDHQTQEVSEINEDNFDAFKEILINMFCLTNKENKQYDPSGELARKIADKIKQGRGIKRDQLKPQDIQYVQNKYHVKVNDDEADAICIFDAYWEKFNNEINWE